jgi:hypothetical protein
MKFWALALLVFCAAILAWVRLHNRPAPVATQAAPAATDAQVVSRPALPRAPLPTAPPPEVVRQISAWSPPPPPTAIARAAAGGQPATTGVAGSASAAPLASPFPEPKKVLTLEELQRNGH